MADFTISRPVPFVVEGADGATYELPRLKDMDAEQIGMLAEIGEVKGVKAQAEATKAFILKLCPDLADEPLTDVGYTILFRALSEGADFALGES